MSPALAGRFSTTAPPGKPWPGLLTLVRIAGEELVTERRSGSRFPAWGALGVALWSVVGSLCSELTGYLGDADGDCRRIKPSPIAPTSP